MSLINKILKETFLIEGKNIGILYHFTTFDRLLYILQSNLLKSVNGYRINNKIYYGISTTRNKNIKLNLNHSNELLFKFHVRIDLDGNLISNNYKIIPYNDFSHKTRTKNTESEELIVTKQGLTNLNKYIIQVILPLKYIEYKNKNILFKIIELLQDKKIKFKLDFNGFQNDERYNEEADAYDLTIFTKDELNYLQKFK